MDNFAIWWLFAAFWEARSVLKVCALACVDRHHSRVFLGKTVTCYKLAFHLWRVATLSASSNFIQPKGIYTGTRICSGLLPKKPHALVPPSPERCINPALPWELKKLSFVHTFICPSTLWNLFQSVSSYQRTGKKVKHDWWRATHVCYANFLGKLSENWQYFYIFSCL